MAVLAPILPLSPAPRVGTVLWQTSRSPEFRRQYVSEFEAALKCRVSPVTVTRWVHEGRLCAVRVRQGRLFVDRRELAAFVKRLPKPGTKTRARVRKQRRMMALRRLREAGALTLTPWRPSGYDTVWLSGSLSLRRVRSQMTSDGQERIRKAYARLQGLKEGLKPDKYGYFESTQATDFNKALDHLIAEDFDVDEFRIQDSEIVELFSGPSVSYNTLVTRLNAVLAYFTVRVTEAKSPEDPPTRKIGFEGPRRTSE